MATTPSFSPPAGRKGYVGETGFVPPNRRPFELPVKEFTSGTPEPLAPMPQQAGKSSFFSFRKQSSTQDNMTTSEEPAKSSFQGTTVPLSVAASPPRASVLVDPYSLPRKEPTLQATTDGGQQSNASVTNPPLPVKPPRSNTQISDASYQTGKLRRRTIHPELRSLISLSVAHSQKIYFSGPLIRCNERNTDGSRSSKDVDWHEVWAQLGGTTLSIWDMSEIEDARRRGGQAPPTYINVTDAFIHVSGPARIPAIGSSPVQVYNDVFTLNTAGANLISFACRDRASLNSWVAALRLALWERARMEEIYTGHLLRMSLCDANGIWKEPKSTLVKGKIEGWTKVRVAGQTDWKRVWTVISAGSGPSEHEGPGSTSLPNTKRNRLSALFGTSVSVPASPPKQQANIAICLSNKSKDRRAPIIKITDVTHAFAVYPERVDLINMSTLIKIEGIISMQGGGVDTKNREGWLLIMLELEQEKVAPMEMLKWIVGLHDAFRLHGRPQAYSWDPLDPVSPMFAYPVGDHKDNLFLLREDAETLNPMIDQMTAVKESFTRILHQKIVVLHGTPQSPPASPPIGSPPVQTTHMPMQLPPLDFETPQQPTNMPSTSFSHQISRSPLPPIEENGRSNGGSFPADSVTPEMKREISEANTDSLLSPGPSSNALSLPISSPISTKEENRLESISTPPDKPIHSSPPHSPKPDSSKRLSDESYFNVDPPRPDSRTDQQSERTFDPPVAVHSPRTSDSYSNVSSRNLSTPVVVASPSPVVSAAQLPPLEPVSSRTQPSPRQTAAHSEIRTSFSSAAPGRPVLTTQSSFHQTQSADHSKHSSPQAGVPRTETPLGFQSPVFLPGGGSADVIQGSPRSVGVQLRDPGSPSPSFTRVPPRSPQVTASPVRSSRILSPPIETQGEDQLPVRSPLSDDGHSSSRQQNIRQDHFSQGNAKRQSVIAKRNLPIPPEHSRTPIGYSIAPTSEGPSIVERLRRQIAEEEGYMDEAGAQYIAQKLLEGSSIDHSDSEGGEAPSAGPSSPASPIPPVPPPSLPVRVPPNPPKSPEHTPTQPLDPADPTADSALLVGPVARKPSGARPAPSRAGNQSPSKRVMVSQNHSANEENNDLSVDALAALTFMEKEEARSETGPARSTNSGLPFASEIDPYASPVRPVMRSTQSDATEPNPYPSSFAASKQAAERKAKAQANIAASQAAAHKPGRPSLPSKGGRAPTKGAWESSEEEEEEEDDDDDDDGSEDEANRGGPVDTPGPTIRSQTHTLYAPQAQQPNQLTGATGMHEFGVRLSSHGDDQPRTRTRNLPSIPQTGGAAMNDLQSSTLRPRNSPHLDEARPRTLFEDEPRNIPSRLRADAPARPSSAERHAPRTNIWSSVLDPDKAGNLGPPAPSNKDTFVTLEPSETMTKAFAPQGLLQAGLQDKQDRSAKRIEEMAREQGDSYVHVPHKPPPPQSGLLGAITAHERERKREGGVGAALTERERERRVAEERQRKIDELQRQQLEYVQQQGMGAEGLGQLGNPMMNPMMGNPMMMNPMMGMMGNPMMGPSYTGYGPPAWGMPQMQMMAQQAAAEAYRNAMVAFSQAGSVAGTPSEIGGPISAVRSTSPAMWGGGMNPMSMYGIPPQMTGQSWGGFGSPMPDYLNMNGMNMSPGMPQRGGPRTSMFGGIGGNSQQQSPDPNQTSPPPANPISRTDTPPTTKPT